MTHFLCDRPVADDATAPHAPSLCSASCAQQVGQEEHAAGGVPSRGGSDISEQPGSGPSVRPDAWPEAWRRLFARTRPAPVLWTYPELGPDLCGQGSAARSACLRDIIGRLGLPLGTSAFWPLRLAGGENRPAAETGGPVGGVLPPEEAALFKGGLELLRPKVVVFIGPRSVGLADLSLALHMPYTQQISRGMLFVLLPEFSVILEQASLIDKACVFLRTAFSGLPAIFQKQRQG